MQIIATLYFSVSDILIGVTQVILATIGLIEDLDCYNFGSSYCYDAVIKNHSFRRSNLKVLELYMKSV